MKKEIGLDVLLSIYTLSFFTDIEKVRKDVSFLVNDIITEDKLLLAMYALIPYIIQVVPEITEIEYFDNDAEYFYIGNDEYPIADYSFFLEPMPEEMAYFDNFDELIKMLNLRSLQLDDVKQWKGR